MSRWTWAVLLLTAPFLIILSTVLWQTPFPVTEAVALFEREVVDLVITDLGMPGMTGLALAAELKRRRPVPIALLTGWADELDPDNAPAVDLIVAKPFTREKLFDALARALPDRVR